MNRNNRILNVSTRPSRKLDDAAAKLLVSSVHPGSIAEAAGITPGALYLANQETRIVRGLTDIKERASTGPTKSEFFDPETRTVMVVESDGFPWGFALEQPTSKLAKDLRSYIVLPDQLADRLLHCPEPAFRELTQAALDSFERPTLKRRLVDAAMSLLRANRDVPRMAAAAAALDNGDVGLAIRLMPPQSDELLYGHGSSVGALYFYTSALIAKAKGAPARTVASLLEPAFLQQPESKRIAIALNAVGNPAQARSKVARIRPFAMSYDLPVGDAVEQSLTDDVLRDAPHVSLEASLAAMQLDQLGIIILLGAYRSNGFYSPMLENLGYFYPAVAHRLGFVHVISSMRELTRPDFVKQWLSGERLARARGVPITVLLDSDDRVAFAQELRGSPTMYLVARDGAIIGETSDATDEPFWSALERLDGLLRAKG